MLFDGRARADELLAEVKARAVALGRRPLVAALRGEETAATRSYLAIKAAKASAAGCDFEVRPYPSESDDADAVIVQLPLDGVHDREACDALPLAQDADVLSARARERLAAGEVGALLPPVVRAVEKIVAEAGLSLVGARAAVIGEGFLVGAPVAMWLRAQGALVTVVTEDTPDLFEPLSVADLVVSGAGVPGLITPDVLKQGVVLIDAGTSEQGGVLRGDADPACADKCALFTPVPGGVGPLAVACLFENVLTLAERNKV